MKKIVFVMPKLGGGGAERVVSTIIQHINKQKFECSLIVFDGNGDYQNDLPKGIDIKILSGKSLISNVLALIKMLRKLKPNVVFSSMRSTSALLGIIKLLLPSEVKLVLRENNTPSVSIAESRYPWIWKAIYKSIFKNADTIICQSDYMINDFKNKFNFTGDNLVRIYNPVDIEMVKNRSQEGPSPFPDSDKKNVVAVGKLTSQKGYDILLESFAFHKEKNRNINLWILGEGKNYKQYKALSSTLGINNNVHFVGRQENPFIWMKHADLFILSSRYEGLPNVLLEALCLGRPVVTTNHPGGTNEVMSIINSKDRIVDLDWNEHWFENLHIDMEIYKSYFDVSVVVNKYEKLFLRL